MESLINKNNNSNKNCNNNKIIGKKNNNNNNNNNNNEHIININDKYDKNFKRKKNRYKIGKWKQEEHDKFLQLYSIYGSNWPKVFIIKKYKKN